MGYAHAVTGRIPEALSPMDAHGAEVERLQVPRFAGLSKNFKGWIMRNLGVAEAADELNLAALDADDRPYNPETLQAAHLDLAEGALFQGDLDRAADELDQAEQLFGGDMTFGWRLRSKAQSHQARLAFALGRYREAADAAESLARHARELSVPRYAIPARLLAARARAREREPVDLDAVEGDLRILPRVMALEAWWLTAEAARDCGVDRWWAMAEERLSTPVQQAGDHKDILLRNASARLDALRKPR